MSLLWYWSWLLLIILHGFIGRNVLVDWFTFFVIYHKVCNWIISQDVNVLLDWSFVCFPVVFRWVCIPWLCFRGFSDSALVCNLWAWVSSIALIARRIDKYVHIVKINGLYYLEIFKSWGLLVSCGWWKSFVSVSLSLLSGVNATTQLGCVLVVSLLWVWVSSMGGFCSFMSQTAHFLKGML